MFSSTDTEHLHWRLYHSSQFNRYCYVRHQAMLGNHVGASKDTALTAKLHVFGSNFFKVCQKS